MMLNLAIGGKWPGDPDETTNLPAKMYVDYIRVYKNNNMQQYKIYKYKFGE